uniref:(Lyso)-N-acylphosphatidylethanolamine lipase n=1 Tax=Sus scrofa TaxID=9823 RepID=A0A8D1PWE1_PIG
MPQVRPLKRKKEKNNKGNTRGAGTTKIGKPKKYAKDYRDSSVTLIIRGWLSCEGLGSFGTTLTAPKYATRITVLFCEGLRDTSRVLCPAVQPVLGPRLPAQGAGHAPLCYPTLFWVSWCWRQVEGWAGSARPGRACLLWLMIWSSSLQNKFLARYVSLPNQNKIWTVTVSPELRDRTPLVMVHGFGGGVGLWILNMDSLSARRTLHTFDLLGFGRSSRPTFPRDPEGAEDEFVTSIETWRETMGIPSMILLGHSLGGFLATSYSIKYPDRVKHLILVDPWGFPLRPTDPSEIRAPPTWVKAVASVLGRSNPLAVLRVAGPWGPGLVQRFRPDFKRKFADFFEDDTISEYIYHCNAQNPSGETAFKAMMESFGWARRPMLERIHLIRKDVPITMIYGANTWIDTSTGKKVKLQRPDSYVRDLVSWPSEDQV